MATVPSQQTFTAGAVLTAAQLNDDLRDAVNFLLTNKPLCKAYAGATTSIANGATTWTTVALNSEAFDNDAMHDNVTNNSRVTIKTAGKYRITVGMSFASNNTGTRRIRVLLNGATALFGSDGTASTANAYQVGCSFVASFAVNDYIEIQGAQSSGGALNTAGTTEHDNFIIAEWVST